MKKCIKCGTENEATALFCAECGTHLDTTPQQFNPSSDILDEEETQLSFRNKIFDHANTVSVAHQDAPTIPHNATLPINPISPPESTAEITTPWFTQYNVTIAAIIVVVLWLGCVTVGVSLAALPYLLMGLEQLLS